MKKPDPNVAYFCYECGNEIYVDEMCYVFEDRVYCEECAKEHHVYACREDDED